MPRGKQLGYTLTYENRPGYLAVLMEGAESLEAAVQFWNDLARKAREEAIDRFLIIDRVNGRLTTSELCILSKLVASLFVGKVIAYVDPKEHTREDNKFGETVILNRGGTAKVFHAEAEALPWLLDR